MLGEVKTKTEEFEERWGELVRLLDKTVQEVQPLEIIMKCQWVAQLALHDDVHVSDEALLVLDQVGRKAAVAAFLWVHQQAAVQCVGGSDDDK